MVTIVHERHQTPLVRRAYDEILRPSFDNDELPSWEFLEDGFLAPQHQVVTIVLDGSAAEVATTTMLGVAVTNWNEGSTIATMSYLATAPQQRGRGVGGRLLAEMKTFWPQAGLSLVLGEVHDPRLHADSPSERPLARLRFYEGAGAHIVGVPWVQPALSPTTGRSRGMLLIALAPVPTQVSSVALCGWAQEYFVGAEGSLPRDPEYHALIERFHTKPQWRPSPVSEFRSVRTLG